jgi:hypothetical protein
MRGRLCACTSLERTASYLLCAFAPEGSHLSGEGVVGRLIGHHPAARHRPRQPLSLSRTPLPYMVTCMSVRANPLRPLREPGRVPRRGEVDVDLWSTPGVQARAPALFFLRPRPQTVLQSPRAAHDVPPRHLGGTPEVRESTSRGQPGSRARSALRGRALAARACSLVTLALSLSCGPFVWASVDWCDRAEPASTPLDQWYGGSHALRFPARASR